MKNRLIFIRTWQAVMLTVGVLFWGCRQVVEIDVPLSDQRLVLNSVFNPDSTLSGAISYSRHILDGGRVLPQGVEISIFEFTQPITVPTKTQIGSGEVFWQNSFRPTGGKTYEIRVKDQLGKTARGITTIPAEVPILNVAVDTVGEDPSGLEIRARITFQDPPGQTNYYRLFVFYDAKFFFFPIGTKPDTLVATTRTQWASFRVNDTNLGELDAMYGQLLFTDTFFDGKENAITIRYTYNERSQSNFRIFLQHLSPELQQYLTTRALQYQTTGDPFAQPVLVYNNVEGGLGIVASYNQSVWFLR